MEKNMKKKAMIFSFGAAIIVLMVSFTSTVAFQSANSLYHATNSPLFHKRLKTIISQDRTASFSSMYVGKNKPIDIPLPIREVLTEELVDRLASKEIKEQIRILDSDLLEKWESILTIAKHNLAEINKIIRQDYTDYQHLFNEFSASPLQEAKDLLLETIRTIDLHDLQQNDATDTLVYAAVNITTGPICNITSGWFCQITSQPICQLTTQPICLITKGFFCWTVYGPLCQTTGIKCHPPTSRPTLCSIFATAGKILKSIIVVVLLATAIFVPLAIFSLVLITMFNPERCDVMREKITVWFNCTTPEY